MTSAQSLVEDCNITEVRVGLQYSTRCETSNCSERRIMKYEIDAEHLQKS